jgi:hypothetical protein
VCGASQPTSLLLLLLLLLLLVSLNSTRLHSWYRGPSRGCISSSSGKCCCDYVCWQLWLWQIWVIRKAAAAGSTNDHLRLLLL